MRDGTSDEGRGSCYRVKVKVRGLWAYLKVTRVAALLLVVGIPGVWDQQ